AKCPRLSTRGELGSMTDDEESQRERRRRLSRAVELHVQRQEGGLPESDQEFLERHAELRDLLEPMVAGTSSMCAESPGSERARPIPFTWPQRRFVGGIATTTLASLVVAAVCFTWSRRAGERERAADADARRAHEIAERRERALGDAEDLAATLRHDRDV